MTYNVGWKKGTQAVENLQPAGLGPFALTYDQCILNIDTTVSAPVGSIYNLPAITPASVGHIFIIKKVIDASLAQIIIQATAPDLIGLGSGSALSIGLINTNESVVLIAFRHPSAVPGSTWMYAGKNL